MGWRSVVTALLAITAAACSAQEPPATTPLLAIAIQRPAARNEVTIRLMVGGDAMPHRPTLLAPERLRDALAPLGPLLSQADAAVANYEAATGDPSVFGKQSVDLAAPPEWMGELAHAHFGVLTVANNHSCDLGRAGLDATLQAASDLGVVPLGAGSDDPPWNARVIAEKDGHHVCALAWTSFVNTRASDGVGGHPNGCMRSHELAVAPFDKRGTERIEHAVARARQQGCDALLVVLHGGREYAPQIWGPRLQARRAAEAGADAVVIHHPHVPSPFEVVTTRDGRRVPVFASVGNLVSNQGESWKPTMFPQAKEHQIALNAWTRVGMLADLAWTWQAGAPGQRPALTWGYHLLWTENDHGLHPSDPMPRIEVRPLDPHADRALIDRLSTDEQGPKGVLTGSCWLAATGRRCEAVRAAPHDVGL